MSISIHALLAESDWVLTGGLSFDGNFYPRSPCGERHLSICIIELIKYFYPRSPCGERRQVKQTCRAEISISIHALLAESDLRLMYFWLFGRLFLSTLSLRRATKTENNCIGYCDFYPRSPCGERPDGLFFFGRRKKFLSTLSLRRATFSKIAKKVLTSIFLSTLSLRRATVICFIVSVICLFLSTLSLRRATEQLRQKDIQIAISIHALLAESDHQTNAGGNESGEFLSTLSLRRATRALR